MTALSRITTSLSIAIALSGFAVLGAAAHDYQVGALKIAHPWARATPDGAKVGAGYLAITNTGSQPDRLIGGSFERSARFEIHEMKMDGGNMTMRQLNEGVAIAPGETVKLEPGGYHLMFQQLSGRLVEKEKVKGTLEFEKAGKVDVEFAVAGIGSKDGSAAKADSHDHHGAH